MWWHEYFLRLTFIWNLDFLDFTSYWNLASNYLDTDTNTQNTFTPLKVVLLGMCDLNTVHFFLAVHWSPNKCLELIALTSKT